MEALPGEVAGRGGAPCQVPAPVRVPEGAWEPVAGLVDRDQRPRAADPGASGIRAVAHPALEAASARGEEMDRRVQPAEVVPAEVPEQGPAVEVPAVGMPVEVPAVGMPVVVAVRDHGLEAVPGTAGRPVVVPTVRVVAWEPEVPQPLADQVRRGIVPWACRSWCRRRRRRLPCIHNWGTSSSLSPFRLDGTGG